MTPLQARADTMRRQAIHLSHQATKLIVQLHDGFDPNTFTKVGKLLDEIEDNIRTLRIHQVYFKEHS